MVFYPCFLTAGTALFHRIDRILKCFAFLHFEITTMVAKIVAKKNSRKLIFQILNSYFSPVREDCHFLEVKEEGTFIFKTVNIIQVNLHTFIHPRIHPTNFCPFSEQASRKTWYFLCLASLQIPVFKNYIFFLILVALFCLILSVKSHKWVRERFMWMASWVLRKGKRRRFFFGIIHASQVDAKWEDWTDRRKLFQDLPIIKMTVMIMAMRVILQVWFSSLNFETAT